MEVPLLKSETREKNQIIAIKVSPDEKHLVVLTGKNLVKQKKKLNQIFLYILSKKEFKLVKNINVSELDEF